MDLRFSYELIMFLMMCYRNSTGLRLLLVTVYISSVELVISISNADMRIDLQFFI
jgi:hypothetical protein